MVEIITTSDVVLDGQRIRYGKIHQAAYQRWNISFKKELSEWGIKRVINSTEKITIDTLSYDRMTLLILPDILGLTRVADGRMKKTVISNGSRITLYPHYAPLDNNCRRIRRGENIVADYYQERNLIILYFNPFPNIPRTTFFKNALVLARGELTNLGNSTATAVNNVEEITENSLSKHAEIFQDNIKKSIKNSENSINMSRSSIESAGRQILDNQRSIMLETTKLEAINEAKKSFLPNFKNELTKLEKQPFVKSVKISDKGIDVDVGEIRIKYNKIIYYIGHIIINITPNQVLILNQNNTRQGYHHPHTNSSGNSCFSEYSSDVSKLLAKLDFTRLIFLLMQFLQAYNSRSPIHKIGYWRTTKDIAKIKKTTRPANQRVIVLDEAATLTQATEDVLINNPITGETEIRGRATISRRPLINTPEAVRRRALAKIRRDSARRARLR